MVVKAGHVVTVSPTGGATTHTEQDAIMGLSLRNKLYDGTISIKNGTISMKIGTIAVW